MAFITFAVHTFVGTGFAVPELLRAERSLPKATVWLNYMCWHIVTGVLFILASCMAAASVSLIHPDSMFACIACFAWISVMSVLVTRKAGIPMYRFPASYLGGLTALLGVMGFAR